MAAARTGTVNKKATKKAPAKPRTRKAAPPAIEPGDAILPSDVPAVNEATPNPVGVEVGGAWLPPTDTAKAAKLPQLTGAAPTTKASPDDAWKVEQIREALRAVTGGANMVAGQRVGATLTMTRDEADAIAQPLTNIINRNPVLRAASTSSDVVMLALATLPYGARIGGEAIETRRQAAEAIDLDGTSMAENA